MVDEPFLFHSADAEEVSSPQEHAEIGQPDSGSPPRSSGWGSRWNVTGSKVQSQWEAFKNRNPNTVQQASHYQSERLSSKESKQFVLCSAYS